MSETHYVLHGHFTAVPAHVKGLDGPFPEIMDESGGRGIGKRIELAILLYRSRVDPRASQAEIARLVGEAEAGREKGYSGSTLTEWLQERNEPRLAAFDALAEVLGGDPWWYAWGVGSPPPNPMVEGLQLAPRRPK